MYNPAAVGHNLGAQHPFYDEETKRAGQTGGIMDYCSCANCITYPFSHTSSICSFAQTSSILFILPRTDNMDWDGTIQFGTFNRLRMCPVLEVRSFPVFVVFVMFGVVL